MLNIDESAQKGVKLGPFTVTRNDIRQFAEAMGDIHPYYIDAEVAQKAGYADVIAPPMFCMRLRGGRMLPEVTLPSGLTRLHAGQEIEFYDEIVAGGRYTITARVADVYEKTGRSGSMDIIVRESVVRDATDRTIITIRERQIVRSPEKKL